MRLNAHGGGAHTHDLCAEEIYGGPLRYQSLPRRPHRATDVKRTEVRASITAASKSCFQNNIKPQPRGIYSRSLSSHGLCCSRPLRPVTRVINNNNLCPRAAAAQSRRGKYSCAVSGTRRKRKFILFGDGKKKKKFKNKRTL